ncbi:hypothetical protein SAMN05444156_3273, partial [Verrucomicrobium sp. GAS474]
CGCAGEDVKTFTFTITQAFLGVDGCKPCAIKFARS